MATTSCPDCGVEQGPGATRCPACGALLDDDLVVYEMDGWEPDERAELDRLIEAEGIPHRWEGDDLVVPGADEEQVDALMDRVEYPDELEEADDADDGTDYEVISELFVAADRLSNQRVVDLDLAADFVAASAAAASAPPPFGVEATSWTQVQQLAEGIVEALEAEADDEVIVRDAATLRDLLRRFV